MSQLDLNMDEKPGVCEHCGSKVVEYKFGLNKGLLGFLKALAAAGEPVTLDKLKLTPSQYTNHALVRFWALARMHSPQNEIETRRGGKWGLTYQGVLFLKGLVPMPKFIHITKKKIIRTSGPEIFVNEVEDGYLYRGDYKEQAAGQL